MFALLFACLVGALEIPSEYASLLQRSQWLRVSDHGRSPCVVVDAYVRPYTQTLFVSLIGICDGLKAGVVWCEIKSGVKSSRKMQKALDVRQGPSDAHGGKIASVFNNGGTEPVKLWYQIGVDCGPVSQAGSVTLIYGNSTFNNVQFTYPVRDVEPEGGGVCTRLYDTKGWTPLDSQLFLEWIEWQLTIGFSVVRVYIYSLESAELWRALAAYARTNKVVLHAWSDGSDEDCVGRSWELAQIAHIADCHLRFEGKVAYSAALDHDEFLQPGAVPSIIDAFDAHYNQKRATSNVLMLEPLTVVPKSCGATSELQVTSFCHGFENPYGKHKYVLRSNEDHPFLMFPGIHLASDGRPVTRIQKKTLQLLHVARFLSPSQSKGRGVNVPWSVDIAQRVRASFDNREDDVRSVYAALGAAETASGPTVGCFKFIDGGSDAGDSLLKIAFPERYPKSGLAAAIKSLDLKPYVCRHVFAFEGNPRFDDQLHLRCAELVQNNITCSTFEGIVGATSGVTEFFVDSGKANAAGLGSSIYQRPGSSTIEVTVFQLTAFLRSATVQSDYVVVKLDIEGGEYEILHALVDDKGRPKACKLVDVLLVEWHASKFTGAAAAARKDLQSRYGGTLESQQNKIVDALKECGVDVRATAGVTD